MTGWPRSLTVLALCTAVGAPALLTGCGAASGEPDGSRGTVTVMTWAPESTNATYMPGMPAMAAAYARWVNAGGGIDGHRLRVLTCNDHNDPVGAGACAQRAVKEGVAAVVGSYSVYGQSFMPTLEAAGIPYIGGYGVSSEEFRSALSYPVNGGQASLLAGSGRLLARDCERIALVRPENVDGDELPVLLDAGLAESGRGPATDIRTTEDAGEYGAQAAAALRAVGAGPGAPADGSGIGSGGGTGSGTGSGSGTGVGSGTGTGCVSAVLGGRTQTFIDSFRRQEGSGRPVRIASVLGSVGQGLVDSTGGKDGPYEGAYVTGWYPVAGDPHWKPMRDVIDKYAFDDNRIDPADAGAETTWIAYTVLRAAVESLGKDRITADDLTRTLDGGLAVRTGGLTPTLRWRFQDMLASRDFPRLVNHRVTFQVVRGGRLVALRKGAVDVGPTLEKASLTE
ncbi:ABC transporter substrate-binding protein [Streptomyces sp. NBC_01089]|uniref:ABC transporter substrate-binding protein n=1 Tax=Streptomyces sp. NBC_01089 TaxID=2903747 RepID=UPI003870C71D|nr:ABC transporter substrate-binding protein [Streptomyces sp. NBC_01089]